MPKLDLLFYFSLSTNAITKSPRIYLVLLSPHFFNILIFTARYLQVTLVKKRGKKGEKVEPTHLEMQMKKFWTITLSFDIKYMNYF